MIMAIGVGQTALPAVVASTGTQSAASIPDFSGIWAHVAFPDVEPPLSGAGRCGTFRA